MAGSGERTEAATPKRRQEARDKGQILKSVEVNTAALLIASAAFLQWGMPGMSATLFELTRDLRQCGARRPTLRHQLHGLRLERRDADRNDAGRSRLPASMPISSARRVGGR